LKAETVVERFDISNKLIVIITVIEAYLVDAVSAVKDFSRNNTAQ